MDSLARALRLSVLNLHRPSSSFLPSPVDVVPMIPNLVKWAIASGPHSKDGCANIRGCYWEGTWHGRSCYKPHSSHKLSDISGPLLLAPK
jgi:hypothetical protein